MAERYYQSRKDRKDESRGMKKRDKDMRLRDYFSGYEARKRMEAEGSDMIHEDRSCIANLPKEVMFKEYPATPYDNYGLNDDIKGIDVQIRDDVRSSKRKSGQPYPDKW